MTETPTDWKLEIGKVLAKDGILVVIIWFLMDNISRKLDQIIGMLA